MNRGTFEKKKKKEAVRRLSQSGRGPRGKSLHSSNTREPDPRHVRRRSTSRQDDPGGHFSGRRVITSESGNKLVIQRSLGSSSPGDDTPDTYTDSYRRFLSSQPEQSHLGRPMLFGKTTVAFPQPGVSFAGFRSNPPSMEASSESDAGERFHPSTISSSSSGLLGTSSIFQPSLFEKEKVAVPGLSQNLLTDEPVASQEVQNVKRKDTPSGIDNVTRNLFGKPPRTEELQESGFPSMQESTVDNLTVDRSYKPHKRILFGKIQEGRPSPNRSDRDNSAKRLLSPERTATSSPMSKRPLTSFEDPFSSKSQDIGDLETFGVSSSQREGKLKKPVIKRSGLFGKALAEASGRISDSSRSQEPSQEPSKSHRPPGDRGRRSSEERNRRSPERTSHGDKVKKHRDENEPATTARRRQLSGSASLSSRRYASPEEIKKLLAIVVKGVPAVANSGSYLKEFFSKFGPVTRVNMHPSRNAATIHFTNHDAAANAKKRVRVLKPHTKPVSIFWRQGEHGSKSENRLPQDDETPPPKPSQRTRKLLDPVNRHKETLQKTTKVLVGNQPKKTTMSVPVHLPSKQVCHNAQERYDILEERDKILRQGLKRQSNLATSKAIRGTCPDMCPEKERYMRVVQRRLHLFEVVPGTTNKVNHDRAVKEYSRSSADQEEPLPHEMRPSPVLTTTMNYLMRDIMNAGRDGHWEDWFDFLWSRTRGIRKDIAQQDLCDLTAIDLMEKCARFHIFCSHRLCEEDLSTIDPKINNENLTKCMQSLKQFYHDATSEGVVCPNEGEFRAYDVLLNLNDRDILRQVQQYRREVRGSEEVNFALKAFSSVSSNNYVKFFKLLRSATYLNACIMHRYFMQVRHLALDVMNKAFSISNTRGSRFPLLSIQSILAFDDIPQASEFCQAHNLAVEVEFVRFNRTAFQHPDIALSVERSRLIIAKNTCTIGEVVNGGPLPADVTRPASSSFDDNGNFKGRTTTTSATAPSVDGDAPDQVADDLSSAHPVVLSSSAHPVVLSSSAHPVVLSSSAHPVVEPRDSRPPPPPMVGIDAAVKGPFPNSAIKEVAREMFLEVIDEMARELVTGFLRVHWLHIVQFSSVQIVQEIVNSVTATVAMEIAREVTKDRDEQRLQEAQLSRQRLIQQQALNEKQKQLALRERTDRLERAASGVAADMLDGVVFQESRHIASEEIRLVGQRLRLESLARCTDQLHSELLAEVADSECRQVAVETISREKALRHERLAEAERTVILERLARHWQRWYRVYTRRIHLKRTLLTFPSAPPNRTPQEQLRVLWAGRRDNVDVEDGRGRTAVAVTLDSPFSVVAGTEDIANSIRRIHYLNDIRRQQAWLPLDLPTLLCDSFHSHHAPGHDSGSGGRKLHQQQQRHYWKLVVSLPGRCASPERELVCDWLKAKIQRGKLSETVRRAQLRDNNQVETLSLYSAKICHVSPTRPCTLSVCTKVTVGSLGGTELTRHQLLGTSGILFVLDQTGQDEDFWQRAKSRLDAILRAKPASPPAPLVVALLSSFPRLTDAVCGERLHLRQLTMKGLVSSWCLTDISGPLEVPQTGDKLSGTIQWLASRCVPPRTLSEDTLKGYLDNGLAMFFSQALHQDAKERQDACLPQQDAHRLINLFNATVRHLAYVVTSHTLTSLSWPPAEFTNSGLPNPNWNSNSRMHHLRDVILAMQLPELLPIDEEDDWDTACKLCYKYLLSLPGTREYKVPLIARVQQLLEKCYRTFEKTCYMSFDAPGCEPIAGHIPWTRIIEECADYVMTTVQSDDRDDREEPRPITVYYIQSEFEAFELPPAWKEAVKSTREESLVQPPRFASLVADTVRLKQVTFAEDRLRTTQLEAERKVRDVQLRPVILPQEPSLVSAAKQSASTVKATLSSAKKELQIFDGLLNQWLYGDGDTTTSTPARHPNVLDHLHESSTDGSSTHLDETLAILRRTVESERRADRLAEHGLSKLLNTL